MALKKSDLRSILKNEDATVDERISEILDLLHNEVDAVKDERDELREQLDEAKKNASGEDGDKWKDKYEKEHSDFESFKADQKKKAERAEKETAFTELLKDAGLSEDGRAKALKYTNLDDIELENGKIKTGNELLKQVSEEWSAYIVKDEKKGTETKGKDGAGSGGGSSTTKEEIMKIKDASERQKKIAENHELFGF